MGPSLREHTGFLKCRGGPSVAWKQSSSFRSHSAWLLVIPLPHACDSREAQPHSFALIGQFAAAKMANVPHNREKVSVSVDKHSPRPDLKETTQTTSASHPSTHQSSAPPQHLVSTAAEELSLSVKVSSRLKRSFHVFHDIVAELMMWIIISLQETAPINTNSRVRVFTNIHAGNQRLQRSKRPHESMHDPSTAWPGQTNADWKKDGENWREIAVKLFLTWMYLQTCHSLDRKGKQWLSRPDLNLLTHNQQIICSHLYRFSINPLTPLTCSLPALTFPLSVTFLADDGLFHKGNTFTLTF